MLGWAPTLGQQFVILIIHTHFPKLLKELTFKPRFRLALHVFRLSHEVVVRFATLVLTRFLFRLWLCDLFRLFGEFTFFRWHTLELQLFELFPLRLEPQLCITQVLCRSDKLFFQQFFQRFFQLIQFSQQLWEWELFSPQSSQLQQFSELPQSFK